MRVHDLILRLPRAYNPFTEVVWAGFALPRNSCPKVVERADADAAELYSSLNNGTLERGDGRDLVLICVTVNLEKLQHQVCHDRITGLDLHIHEEAVPDAKRHDLIQEGDARVFVDDLHLLVGRKEIAYVGSDSAI